MGNREEIIAKITIILLAMIIVVLVAIITIQIGRLQNERAILDEKTKVQNMEYSKNLLKKQRTIYTLDRIVNGNKLVLKNQSDQIDLLKQSVEKLKEDNLKYLDSNTYIIENTFTAKATAYSKSDDQGTADGITATGTHVKQGRTIAVDPKVIPLGSLVYIESDSPYVGGFYRAEDTGNMINGRHIDVYMDSHSRCISFGKQTVKVMILKKRG